MEELKLKVSNDLKHIAQPKKIGKEYTEEEKVKLSKAAKDFESLFTSLMLKSMTQTTEGGLFGGEDSYGGDILDTVFESEVSSFISKNRGLGVADMIYKNMTGDDIKSIAAIIKERAGAIKGLPKKETEEAAPKIKGTSIERLQKYDDIIKEASKNYGVDEKLIKSVILTESAANEKAVSKVKAKGLMQLMDATADDLGVKDVWDPKENIFGGTKYLAQMFRQYDGDVELALAAYNAGPANVEKYNGVPPFEETKNYIARVKNYINNL